MAMIWTWVKPAGARKVIFCPTRALSTAAASGDLQLISPRLEILEVSTKPLSERTYRVRLVVQNTGWLPTYITKKALEKKIRGVVCEIELPAGAVLETGKSREEPGQLEGRAYKGAMPDSDSTLDRAKVEWTVRVPSKSPSSGPIVVKLIARHERGGWARAEVRLE